MIQFTVIIISGWSSYSHMYTNNDVESWLANIFINTSTLRELQRSTNQVLTISLPTQLQTTCVD